MIGPIVGVFTQSSTGTPAPPAGATFLLLEDGTRLLLQDSSNTVLEDSTPGAG